MECLISSKMQSQSGAGNIFGSLMEYLKERLCVNDDKVTTFISHILHVREVVFHIKGIV